MTAAQSPDRRAVEARLALIYGAIFLVFGVQSPFLPVWLSARGLGVAEIGLALAVPRVLQVFLAPALSRWADKRGGVVAMLALSCLTMTLLFAALAATTGLTATLIVLGLLFCAQSGVAETLVFALFGRWVAGADRAAGMMILGGLAASARWAAMAFDPGDFVLALAQAGHGLSFAATHAGAMLLIAELAPAERRAEAQGWMTAAVSGLTAALTVAGGPLIVRFGERSYFVMALFALAGTLLAASVAALRARESGRASSA